MDTGEYHSVFKKKETLPFSTTWMDLEDVMLREQAGHRKKRIA